jgi:hypothetical protein
MRQLTRYVLFELVAVFLVTLTGITLLLILAGVAKEGLREGLGLDGAELLAQHVTSAIRSRR